MRIVFFFALVFGVIAVSVFQNCSPTHQSEKSILTQKSFDIFQVYPYSENKMNYFDNIQLTNIVEIENFWHYQFVAGVVYIDDPALQIDVEIKILDQDDKLFCLSKVALVNAENNHIVIDNCKSSVKPDSIKIKIFAKLKTEPTFSNKPINSYTFPLNTL